MEFKVDDKVVFSEEIVLYTMKYYRYSESDARQVMEVTKIKPSGFHVAEVMSNRNKTIPFGNKENYRLATESEIKIDEIKRMFVK